MRRIFNINCVPFLALSFAMLLNSCTEKAEIIEDEVEEAEEVFRFEFKAVKDQGDQTDTRALSEVDYQGTPRIEATFKKGDIVYMYKATLNQEDPSGPPTVEQVGILTAMEDGVETTLTGDVDPDLAVTFQEFASWYDESTYTAPNFSLLFTYKHPLVFDYTGQKGTLKDIDDNYDYAVAEMGYQNEDGEDLYLEIDHENMRITLPEKIIFKSMQAIVKFVLYEGEGTDNPIIPDKLTLDTALDIDKLWIGPDDYIYVENKIVQYFNPRAYNFDIQDNNYIRRGPLVVNPSSNTNEVYVSVPGRDADIYYSYRCDDYNVYMRDLSTKKFMLTAEVGSDIYYYERLATYDAWASYCYEHDMYDNVNFVNNYYYVIEVHMNKVSSIVSDPDVEMDDATGQTRYGQGTVIN
ncbi:MAG: hypothetical protein K6F06_09895 [Bacteroidales bacterium]|nr:hypothetical protein [Bacteroidales bacterium]